MFSAVARNYKEISHPKQGYGERTCIKLMKESSGSFLFSNQKVRNNQDKIGKNIDQCNPSVVNQIL
jgi:hypothetical protein